MEVDPNPAIVPHAMEVPEEQQGIRDPLQFCKLYVGGCGSTTKVEDLKKHFSPYGEIEDIFLLTDRKTKCSKGYGFLTFTSMEAVDKVQRARPHIVKGQEIITRRALSHQNASNPGFTKKAWKIFVSNLAESSDETDLIATFKNFGTIKLATVVYDQATGKSRRFGFVEFEDYDAVDKIILLETHHVKGKHVLVKKGLNKLEIQNLKSGLPIYQPKHDGAFPIYPAYLYNSPNFIPVEQQYGGTGIGVNPHHPRVKIEKAKKPKKIGTSGI